MQNRRGAGDFRIEGDGFGTERDARLRGLGWVGELVGRNRGRNESGRGRGAGNALALWGVAMADGDA